MTSWILTPQSDRSELPEMGGKAGNLATLSQARLPVPAWFCVRASAYDETLGPIRPEVVRLLATLKGASDHEHTAAVSRAIMALFESVDLPDSLVAQLDDAVAGLPASGLDRFAVRSSAVAEDSPQDSFAGQFDSFLFVHRSEIAHYVKRCWASAFGHRLLVYLRTLGRSPLDMRVAVIVQRMIDSRASGVLFTANPVDGSDEMVLVASYGLGEGVVSDQVATDTTIIPRDEPATRTRIAHKELQMVGGDCGTHTAAVPEAHQDVPVLSPTEVETLRRLATRIAQLFEAPQDIEWARDAGGRFWITQARPITALPAGPAGRIEVFDNSNIVEGYPGVTTPLTFSFIRKAYEKVFRRLFVTAGLSRRELAQHQETFAHLLGFIDGRVYYNLSSWHTMLSLLPLSARLQPAWRAAAGVQEPPPADSSEAGRRRTPIRQLPRSAWVAAKLVWHFTALERSMGLLHRDLIRVQGRFWREDRSDWDAGRLVERYHELFAHITRGWEVTLLNDLYAVIFTALSRQLLAGDTEHEGDEAGDLFSALLCGEPGLASAEPVYSAVALGEQVRADEALRSFLTDGLSDTVASDAWLDALRLAGFDAFAGSLADHLWRYGDRCPEELKLEARVFRSDPASLIRSVLGYAAADLSVDGMQARERDIRSAAEARLARWLAQRPLRRWPVKGCLWAARRSIRLRESARLDRARAFGIMRAVVTELGQRLVDLGVLGDTRDIFLLGIDEVVDFVTGVSLNGELMQLVEQRRSQHARYLERCPASRLEVVCGLSRAPEATRASGTHLTRHDSPRSLLGVGCSAGTAVAEAVIVRDPSQSGDVAGKVLVAESTDPGWVFLMVSAAALVVERGSILSHTAIIGRELGIPTVVGVADATRLITDGDWVLVNGGVGTVEVHEAQSAPRVEPRMGGSHVELH